MVASSEDSLNTTKTLLNNIQFIEEQSVDVAIKNSQPGSRALTSIALLKDLKLSFSGQQFNNPLIKSASYVS